MLVVNAKINARGQKRILEQHYGKGDNDESEAVKAVQRITTERTEAYEEKINSIVDLIQQVDENIVPKDVFNQLLQKFTSESCE